MIFVIDATDIDRLSTASEELSAMLNEEELREAALLVFANKQDQPGAKGAGEISEALRLGELKDRNWSIVACSAVDGRGINEGMDWLVVSCSVFEIIGITLLTISATANNTIGVMNFVIHIAILSIPAIQFGAGIQNQPCNPTALSCHCIMLSRVHCLMNRDF